MTELLHNTDENFLIGWRYKDDNFFRAIVMSINTRKNTIRYKNIYFIGLSSLIMQWKLMGSQIKMKVINFCVRRERELNIYYMELEDRNFIEITAAEINIVETFAM